MLPKALRLNGTDAQRDPVDRVDARRAAGRNRPITDVQRGPTAATILDAASLAGRELLRDDNALVDIRTDGAKRLVHELRVDRSTQREHRRDGEHGEQQPLPRYR